MGGNINTLACKHIKADGADRDKRCRQPSGEMSSSAVILKSEVFAISTVVCMRWAGERFCFAVIFRVLVLILNQKADRCSAGIVFKDAAYNLNPVTLDTCCRNLSLWFPLVQLFFDKAGINFDSGRHPVNNCADGRTVGFPENRNSNVISKCILHSNQILL